jgi:hypothetical protein
METGIAKAAKSKFGQENEIKFQLIEIMVTLKSLEIDCC